MSHQLSRAEILLEDLRLDIAVQLAIAQSLQNAAVGGKVEEEREPAVPERFLFPQCPEMGQEEKNGHDLWEEDALGGISDPVRRQSPQNFPSMAADADAYM